MTRQYAILTIFGAFVVGIALGTPMGCKVDEQSAKLLPGDNPTQSQQKTQEKKCIYYKGQAVVFVSGGPAMTVTSAHRDNKNRCYYWTAWFTKDGEYETGVFKEPVLRVKK